MEMISQGSTPIAGSLPLVSQRRRSSSVSVTSVSSLASRVIKHVSAYRIQLLVLVGLLVAAYHLPPSATDGALPAVNYWSWSYLNRQEAPVSAWLVDDRGVSEGNVANGGWNRGKNGLLVVPKEVKHMRRHPIEVLIKEAQFKAKRLRTTRPTTLKQATRRYWKMFHMDPPRGFDKWFSAFGFSPSILPPAHESFVPFLSVPGQVLRERLHTLEDVPQTFAVEFRDGKIADVRGQQKDNERARDLLLLLAPIAHHIPDPLTIYFNTDDVPRFIASYPVLNASTSYGAQATLWPQEDRESLEQAQKGTWGWYWPCGRETPVGRQFRDAILEEEQVGVIHPKTFVWDHKKTMDYCESKELFDQHGLFLYGQPQPGDLTPLFSTCRSRWSMDIPSTPLEAINQTVDAVPWRKKDIPKLYWRGKMTGLFADKNIDWRNSQRLRLHGLGHPKHPEERISVLQKSRHVGGGWERVERTLGSAAEEWLDVGLVDGPVQCEKKDGTCDEIAREIEFSERVEWQDTNPSRHQFVVDVDGNGWSSRMRRVLLRGSVVLKATVFPEWYSDIFIPYYHYVPLQNNYSDLWDILAFFTARPDAARLIGKQGRDFVLENWRWEDMQAYMLLSLLEYARVMSDDREAMTYSAHREHVR